MRGIYHDATRSQNLESRYAYAIRKLSQGLIEVQNYLCELDGHVRPKDMELISEFNKDAAKVNAYIYDGVKEIDINWHELSDSVREWAKLVNRFDLNLWENECHFFHTVTQWLFENDYDFEVEYNQPCWSIKIVYNSAHMIEIRNNPDIEVEVEYNNVVVMSTRNMTHVTNYLKSMERLLN